MHQYVKHVNQKRRNLMAIILNHPSSHSLYYKSFAPDEITTTLHHDIGGSNQASGVPGNRRFIQDQGPSRVKPSSELSLSLPQGEQETSKVLLLHFNLVSCL